jgi:hypothetical protein
MWVLDVCERFRWVAYYELEGDGNPSVETIRVDLLCMRNPFASNPNYLYINGRWALFVYSDAKDDLVEPFGEPASLSCTHHFMRERQPFGRGMLGTLGGSMGYDPLTVMGPIPLGWDSGRTFRRPCEPTDAEFASLCTKNCAPTMSWTNGL